MRSRKCPMPGPRGSSRARKSEESVLESHMCGLVSLGLNEALPAAIGDRARGVPCMDIV